MRIGAVSVAGRPRSLGGTGSARSWLPQARWRRGCRGRGGRRWWPRRRRSRVCRGFAQPDNLFFELGTDRAGIVVGAARVRFERRRALGLVAFDQLLDPVAGDVVLAGDLAFAAPFQHRGGDDKLRLRHGRPPRLKRCQLCRETAANYVVKPDTVSPTAVSPTVSARPREMGSDELW